MERWCREYGPFFKLRIGNRKMLVVGDHQAVASLLCDRPDGLRRTSGDTSRPCRWCQSVWSGGGVGPAQQGVAIDLQADLMRYTVDTIAGLAFGAQVNTLESDGDVIQRHLDKIFPALIKRILAPVLIWRFVRTDADRQLERSIAQVNSAVAGFII